MEKNFIQKIVEFFVAIESMLAIRVVISLIGVVFGIICFALAAAFYEMPEIRIAFISLGASVSGGFPIGMALWFIFAEL